MLWLGLIGLNLLVTPMRDGETLLDTHNIINDFARALHLENGSSALMALGGVLVVLQERNFSREPVGRRLLYALLAAGTIVCIASAVHGDWIISKNIGTLPWCLYVTALSMVLYTLLRILEEKGWTGWFKAIAPAGTATAFSCTMPSTVTFF